MMKRTWFSLPLAAVVLGFTLTFTVAGASAADRLKQGFRNPPDQTKPWCYWYWISDNISKEGITKDLEAMARVGIGEALIGNIYLDDVPAGKVKVLTPEWWSLVAHTLSEGGRTGVKIGMFNCPGWSQSGGPWIKPEQAMRYLASSETRVRGPLRLEQKLPLPREPFQDVAVLAFPVPLADSESISAKHPRIVCTPELSEAGNLVDGDLSTDAPFPKGAGLGSNPFTIQFELGEPFTARSLQIVPTDQPLGAECELSAADDAGKFTLLRRFKCDRSNMTTGVGFLPRGPVTVAFPAVSSKQFRLKFTGVFGSGRPALAEINLSAAARLEAFVEKQLGKMHPTPLPMWDTYLWSTQAEPDNPGLGIAPEAVRDLSGSLGADGTLRWDVPAGDWLILRVGMTPTGMRNGPASPEGQGLEVDKMNRPLAQFHFNAFIGEVLKRVPASDRKAFKEVIADSYEMGSQNWTDGFDVQFKKHFGYDPKPWLPVLTGRIIGSADQSERFLWDLRRLVAERVATDYVGGLREACKPHRLGLWLENYGHWGFPSEFLKYGSESDRIGGEFWVTGDLGSIELRAASSCVNTYGKGLVSAESFTGGPAFQNAPSALKARGDWAFCEGVNHMVLHVYIHQPWEDKVPGVNAWFGTEFNRHNTWFDESRAWVDYIRRCCWLLQQGNRVADVAYFIGEDAPKMTGIREPPLPSGRDFDYINSEVIENSLRVKNGMLTLPHGTSYRVLVLPKLTTMRPELLEKIVQLVKDGATVWGFAPMRSPSLQDFPRCDDEVGRLARALWGEAELGQAGERRVGKGRIVWGKSLDAILESPPDFESSVPLRFTHRHTRDTEIYFVANSINQPVTATASFRVAGRAPELWQPDTGKLERPAVYKVNADTVSLPLFLGPQGSIFVVFRSKAAPASQQIVSVSRNNRELLSTGLSRPESTPDSSISVQHAGDFSFAVWVRPRDGTTILPQTNQGIVGLGDKRNDLFMALHGDTFGGSGHAGCGLAVGTNGICVFEHGADYFAPTLVFAALIQDWTHVTVVYRGGQPSLYLNGKMVHTGLRSRLTVHSGAAAGVSPQFRGQAGLIQRTGTALNDAEVAALASTMPRPGQSLDGPGIELLRSNGGGGLEALLSADGNYELRFADGTRRAVKGDRVPAAIELRGPWRVRFTPGRGAPESMFEELVDWTTRPEEGIKHYSGRAAYTLDFDRPAAAKRGESTREEFWLDLGEVRDLATVRLNGTNLGTLWMAPWRQNVTAALRPGKNTLEVEVVNVWNNRLVGDLALPQEQRHTQLLAPTVNKNTPLLPGGLLGPVKLHIVLVQNL